MRLYGFIYVDEFYPDSTPEIVIASHDEEDEVIVNRIIQEFELEKYDKDVVIDMINETVRCCGEGVWSIDITKKIIAKVLYLDDFKQYLRGF